MIIFQQPAKQEGREMAMRRLTGAVSQQYASPGKFQGGRILDVEVTVEKAQYLDLEKEAQGAFARN